MNIEELRNFCLSLKGAEESINKIMGGTKMEKHGKAPKAL